MTAKIDRLDERTAPAAPPSRWGFAALVAGNLALSLTALVVRLADDVGPMAVGVWRLALALPVLLLLMRRETGGHMPSARALWIAVGAGIFFALDLAAWHIGILQTKVANATLFGNSASLLLVIWGIMLSRALPRGWPAFAILLAFAGSALLMGQSYEASSAYLVGDLLSLLAGALYTGYVLMMQRVRDEIGPWSALAISSVAGIPILLAAAVMMGEVIVPGNWIPLIALALMSQIVGQGLLIWALPRFSPLVVGLTLLVQPVVAAVAGWLIFGEILSAMEIFGGAMVAASLVLIRLPSRTARPI
ncbi:MAG: DMT family transporter [Sphingopyxis sp.]|nr:DMT family transporter [Sphingopyxis sp.]